MSRPTERYPDPREFDETLYNNLTQLPNDKTLDLQFLKSHVDPQVDKFNIPRESVIRGMQANMFTIEVTRTDGSSIKCIAKRIVPMELPDKASEEIWKEFVKSVRKEIEFYSEIMTEKQTIRSLFPKVYYSDGTPVSLDDRPQETSFVLIMEDLTEKYYQTPMMNADQARSVMKSLAKLHAHYWNIDQHAERGGFWVLQKRIKHNEMEIADETWNKFLERFPEIEALHPDIRSIGRRLKEKSWDLDAFVNDGACTRIHGDAKGWNLFFSKESADVLMIDLQWTGRGHPLQDVAYALTTTLSADELKNMDSHVDLYVDVLTEELKKNGVRIDLNLRTSFDNVWMDYARVIVSGLWKNLNKESIEKNKLKVGPSMINRSIEHVFFITKRLIRLLKL